MRGDRRPIPDSNGRSLDDVRSRLSGLHFAKDQLSNGEAEILFLAECLLRYIDADEKVQPAVMKVAVCEYLISVNKSHDTGDGHMFIPPTAINWLGDGIVSAIISGQVGERRG